MSDHDGIDYEHVRFHARQISEGVDNALVTLLREAYDAGYDHGDDDACYAARGVGPQYGPGVEPDSFEKWLASKVGGR